MRRLFRTVGRKLALLVASFAVALVCVVGILVWLNIESMFEARKHEIKSLVQTAFHVVDLNFKATQSGTLTEADAKARTIQTLRSMHYEPNGFFVIYDDTLHVVLNPAVPKAEGSDMTNVKDANGFTFAKAVYDTAKASRDGSYVSYYYRKGPSDETPYPKTSYALRFQPWGWTIITGVYTDDIIAAAIDQAEESAGVGLLALMIVSLIAFLIVRGLTRRLNGLGLAMKDLANGRIDADIPISRSGDEIDKMAETVIVFRANARERDHLAADARDRDSSKLARQREIDALVSEFQARVGGILQTVRNSITTLSATATDMQDVATDASNRAQSVNSISTANAQSIQSVAGGAEELSSSVREISQLVERASSVIERAATLTHETDQSVAGLAVNARTIGDVVNLIQAIAEQTNLLALNATIESARAGEAGRGFAVVASEVKALAGQTAKATDDIRRQIETMQSATSGAVQAISAIVATMADVQSFVASISDAVAQQNSATGEISLSIQTTARGAADVSNEFSGVVSGIDHANQVAGAVAKVTGTLANETEALESAVTTFLKQVGAA